jgi:hypothetical protein
MPKYRFEFMHEANAEPVVLDLDDVEAAKAQATQAMADSVLDHVAERHDPSKLLTRIYDEAGYVVATVDFHSVFPEEPAEDLPTEDPSVKRSG